MMGPISKSFSHIIMIVIVYPQAEHPGATTAKKFIQSRSILQTSLGSAIYIFSIRQGAGTVYKGSLFKNEHVTLISLSPVFYQPVIVRMREIP
jgi:hypothetical protein